MSVLAWWPSEVCLDISAAVPHLVIPPCSSEIALACLESSSCPPPCSQESFWANPQPVWRAQELLNPWILWRISAFTGKLTQGKKSTALTWLRSGKGSRNENSSNLALHSLSEQPIAKFTPLKQVIHLSSCNQKGHFPFLTSVPKHHFRM